MPTAEVIVLEYGQSENIGHGNMDSWKYSAYLIFLLSLSLFVFSICFNKFITLKGKKRIRILKLLTNFKEIKIW